MLKPGVLQLGGARDRDLLCHQVVTGVILLIKIFGLVGRRITVVHHLGFLYHS